MRLTVFFSSFIPPFLLLSFPPSLPPSLLPPSFPLPCLIMVMKHARLSEEFVSWSAMVLRHQHFYNQYFLPSVQMSHREIDKYCLRLLL